MYIAPMGLGLSLDAGQFQQAEHDDATQTVKLTLAADPFTPVARLRVEQTGVAQGAAAYSPRRRCIKERGADVVSLADKATTVVLLRNKQHQR
jgi:hypothetical protein